MIEKLETCHHLLLGSAPKENGVILEAPVKASRDDLRKKKKKKEGEENTFQEIAGSFEKNPFSGRVGEKANVMKRHYNVTLRDIQSQTPRPRNQNWTPSR